MNTVISNLTDGSERIMDRIVFVNDMPVGVLCPSVSEGISDTGVRFVVGPRGMAKINNRKTETIWATLVETGSILFGKSEEVLAVAELMNHSPLSRTISYLCSIARNCGELLDSIDRLSKSSVALLGCGGVGSLAAGLLAGAGIKSFCFVDPDRIEQSNFNRQLLWQREHIGRSKVEVLQAELNKRFEHLDCRIFMEWLTESNIHEFVEGCNAIVLSADEPVGIGRVPLIEMARQGNFMLAICGYVHGYATVEFFGKGENALLSSSDWNETITWQRNPYFIGPSFGPTNAEIAGIVSSLIVHECAGISTRQGGDTTIAIAKRRMSWAPGIFPRSIE